MPPKQTREGPVAKTIPTLQGPRYSQSLERGLAILACFDSDRPLLGIAEIAVQLHMSRSTTHRYVATLRQLGYLEQGPHQKYRLSSPAGDIGASALRIAGLRAHARPILQKLRSQTGDLATALGILDDTHILYAERLPSLTRGPLELAQPLGVGTRRPAHTSAIGKTILAHLPHHRLQSLLQEIQFTTTPRAKNSLLRHNLEAELKHIRDEGIALDDHPHNGAELATVAAPVHAITRNGRRLVAAIDLTTNAATSARELAQLHAPKLLTATQHLSAQLEGLNT